METDYDQIAGRYDKNPIRDKPVDPIIGELINLRDKTISVLDVACGTGNYLNAQATHYGSETVRLVGADKSVAMLEVAKGKSKDIEYVQSRAEELPFPPSSFDYVRNEYSMHHFSDKRRVINQVYRVLKSDGLFISVNICPEYCHRNWIYDYFPAAETADENRFWPVDVLFEELSSCGFTVDMAVRVAIREFDYEEAIAEAENRDMSQLNMISENDYRNGLSKMREDKKHTVRRVIDVPVLSARCRKPNPN